jgi:hypothetical protein
MRRVRRHCLGARRSRRPPDSRHVEARSSIPRRVTSAADDAAKIAGACSDVWARQRRERAVVESSRCERGARSFACLVASGNRERGANWKSTNSGKARRKERQYDTGAQKRPRRGRGCGEAMAS